MGSKFKLELTRPVWYSPKIGELCTKSNCRYCNLTIVDFDIGELGEWRCTVRDWRFKRRNHRTFNLAMAVSNNDNNFGYPTTVKDEKFYIESYHPR